MLIVTLVCTLQAFQSAADSVDSGHLNIAVAHVKSKITQLDILIKLIPSQIPPDALIRVDPTGNLTFHGPFVQIVKWLSDRLHFT